LSYGIDILVSNGNPNLRD